MEHPEPEVLALAALGETLDDATRAHVDSCAECAAEIASYATVVAAGRTVATDGSDSLVAPPARVWDRIRAELNLPADLEPDAEPRRVAAKARTLRARTTRPSDGETRKPAVRWLAIAAAAGIVIGGGGATWWAGRSAPAPVVLEAAVLDALPAWSGATGAAKVEVAADGTRSLVVTLRGAKTDGGYHEVWLIDKGVTKLIGIGVLDGSTGTFALPPDLNLGEFPVVDISEEHFDGNPAHSGDSIVRGILKT